MHQIIKVLTDKYEAILGQPIRTYQIAGTTSMRIWDIYIQAYDTTVILLNTNPPYNTTELHSGDPNLLQEIDTILSQTYWRNWSEP